VSSEVADQALSVLPAARRAVHNICDPIVFSRTATYRRFVVTAPCGEFVSNLMRHYRWQRNPLQRNPKRNLLQRARSASFDGTHTGVGQAALRGRIAFLFWLINNKTAQRCSGASRRGTLAHVERGARLKSGEGSSDPGRSRAASAPLIVVVSLSGQSVTVYSSRGKMMEAPVSTGMPGYETPVGIYSVLQMRRDHYSNLHNDAPHALHAAPHVVGHCAARRGPARVSGLARLHPHAI
jgi:L,D-transpeptidase catalytic domain